MTLEEITELREKIRKKVETVQEEEMVSQGRVRINVLTYVFLEKLNKLRPKNS